MCGIVALTGEFNPMTLVEMTRAIRHRGPDDEGYLLVDREGRATAYRGRETVRELAHLPDIATAPASFSGAGFGHRRLSIVDLSHAGHQPISSPDGRWHLVFNGAIYNWSALRSELSNRWAFAGKCDTEVLLAAFANFGMEGAMEKCEGMWAFGLYDAANAVLHLGRDRFGEKPLFLTQTSGGWAAGSEIKALLAVPGVERRADPAMILQHLVYRLEDSVERTPFVGISRIPAATLVTLRSGSTTPVAQRYWSVREEVGKVRRADSETLLSALTESVRLRLESDVRAGTMLSGGVDSAFIAALAAREVEPSVLHAVSARFPGVESQDESAAIDEVVGICRLAPVPVYPKPDDMFSRLTEYIWHQEVPGFDFAGFAVMNVAEAAHQAGIKVLLDGFGADELFAGYYDYVAPWIKTLERNHGRETARTSLGDLARNQRDLPVSSIERTVGWRKPPLWTRLLYPFGRWRRPRRPSFIRRDFWESKRSHLEALPSSSTAADLTEARIIDIESGPLSRFLRNEDRMAMRVGIETRLPFLDRRIVRIAFGLEPDRMIDGWTKRILRDALSTILPGEIAFRGRKVGFNVPAEPWLKCVEAAFQESARSEAIRSLVDPIVVVRMRDPSWRYYTMARIVNLSAWVSSFKTTMA